MRGIRVPLLDLGAQYAGIRDEILAAVIRVCDSQRFILGAEVAALEGELARLLEVRHAVGVSSGSDALLVSLMALGVGPGDEVITSTYSFFATAGAIARVGARPVFVDIDPETYNLAPDAVAGAVTPRTKAILPVHLFGLSADLDPIVETARAADVPVVEDACQAVAARYRGRVVGGLGSVGCVSFFPSKTLGGFGDGGVVLTQDDAVAERVRRLRAHGAREKYHHDLVGGNFRLDELQAAVVRVKVSRLEGWLEARRRHARRYAQLFAEAGIDAGAVRVPHEPAGRTHTYHQYVIRAARRDALRAHLDSRRIGTAVYYPVPLHRQVCFAELALVAGECPHAEAAARETLALPVYAELTDAQLREVVGAVAEFYR